MQAFMADWASDTLPGPGEALCRLDDSRAHVLVHWHPQKLLQKSFPGISLKRLTVELHLQAEPLELS